MIRQARKDDVEAVIPLILVVLKDMELPFVQKHGEAVTLEVLRKGYLTEKYRYSYQRGIVAEVAGEVVGVLFGYSDSEEGSIDLPLVGVLEEMGINGQERLFVDKETRPDEWYLDTLSVRSDQRGKGIGTQLLNALPNYVGQEVVALNVDQTNSSAKKLYQRLGFEASEELMISGHWYEHMKKNNQL